MQQDLVGIRFSENGAVDAAQLNALYRLIGWDRFNRRTPAETVEMLKLSSYKIAAYSTDRSLVGFTRICGDPYVVQILDVITHPEFRRRGIATQCMQGVVSHLRSSCYVTATLTCNDDLKTFYQPFGFQVQRDCTMAWKPPA